MASNRSYASSIMGAMSSIKESAGARLWGQFRLQEVGYELVAERRKQLRKNVVLVKKTTPALH